MFECVTYFIKFFSHTRCVSGITFTASHKDGFLFLNPFKLSSNQQVGSIIRENSFEIEQKEGEESQLRAAGYSRGGNCSDLLSRAFNTNWKLLVHIWCGPIAMQFFARRLPLRLYPSAVFVQMKLNFHPKSTEDTTWYDWQVSLPLLIGHKEKSI